MHLTITQGLQRLADENKEFVHLFEHGTLLVEIYKPDKVDRQTPHDRDEVYIIASGSGQFYNDGDLMDVKQGDLLFVKAGLEHRFLNFTDDFSTWVLFYGPVGGEVGV